MAETTVLDALKNVADLDETLDKLRRHTAENDAVPADIARMEDARRTMLERLFSNLTPWDKVLLARHPNRPYMLDYVAAILEDFVELHGDRAFADDGAMITGLARLNGRPLAVIGQQKGRDLKSRQQRNFGAARPEGYRKAVRVMQMAAKFHLPILTLIDTAGAAADIGADERGISEAIARAMFEMSALPTPIVSVVIGEGGSGGALGIAVADRVLMLEHAVYSVIPPEGCAAILWRDPEKKAEAANALNLTAQRALELGIIDAIIPEPLGGAQGNWEDAASNLKHAVVSEFSSLEHTPISSLLSMRYAKFRCIGEFSQISETDK